MSMNRPSIESYINSELTNTVPPTVDTNIMNEYLASVVKTGETVQAIGVDEKKIANDPMTTDVGKQDKFRTLADHAVPKFAALGRVIGEADSTIDRVTALMLDPLTTRPKDMDATEAYNREREIRVEVGRVGANLEFLRAVETNDLEVVRALLGAPGKPWISEDIRDRGERAFAERSHPELFAKRRSVQYLNEHLAALAEMVRQWLVGLGANPETAAKTLHLK